EISNNEYKVNITKENQTMVIKVIDKSNYNNTYISTGEVIGYIDISAPNISIASITNPSGSNNWYTSYPLITISKSDSKSGLKSYEYSISTDGGSSYSGVTVTEDTLNLTTITVNQNGSNIKVRIRAKDKVGNYSEYVYTDVLKVDTASLGAPTITGGSTSWTSTSRTISVSSAPTSISGIAKYQYYMSTSSTSQTGGSWKDVSGISQVISTNGTYYIYFRAVNNAGKVSTVSSPQITKIDNVTPTITAKGSSYTIVQGSSNTLPSTYFNVSTSGASGIASTTCKVGSTTYTNTSSMAVGTNTLTCTTTSNAGKSASASTSIIVISTSAVNKTFDYTGDVQTYTVPVDGVYQVEVWGAQGGTQRSQYPGGKGGYAEGQTYLTAGTVLYIYVGGTTTTRTGGYNGGGSGGQSSTKGGGGATDIRIYGTALENRIIVAGGGGGADYYSSGGAGGGVNGVAAENYEISGDDTDYYNGGGGGTQTAGGWGRFGLGIFGKGGDSSSSSASVPGGGGGWYGGGVGNGAGGGGSGYVGNLSSTSMSTGVRSGNGVAQITYITSSKGTVSSPAQHTADFSYTGNVQIYTIVETGVYKLEVWGAQGANFFGTYQTGYHLGGQGGYAQGQIQLTQGTVLYIYVGGTTSSKTGGYNGGGSGGQSSTKGGGGATDIRIYGTALENRIIVAGGGGGANGYSAGGAGGGINGISAVNYELSGDDTDYYYGGTGGTQTAGGTGQRGTGSFGIGASVSSSYYSPGGGGGWYGGGAGTGAAGGGSGYIGTLINSYNITGNLTTVPTFVGGYMTGKEGNGYSAITKVS
ncbi:MAG: glycine rich domain-containing protein, partial [Bacilli bacterium]|nr:glycine rich domain-containing protein [Bacilli bacterium]